MSKYIIDDLVLNSRDVLIVYKYFNILFELTNWLFFITF